MTKAWHTHTTSISEHLQKKKHRKAPIELDEIHRKHGYYDGKIFYASDKVTFTFLQESTVIVIHLDSVRHELYLNGHKITSLKQHKNLPEFIMHFKNCLAENPKTSALVKTLDTIVSQM